MFTPQAKKPNKGKPVKQGKATRVQAARAIARDLAIPQIKDPDRRKQLGEDDAAWLRHYISDVFYNPFTDDQQELIADCGHALRYGIQKCKAAPRGDGKSSIIKFLMLKYSLYRQVRFPLVIAATFSKAQQATKDIKDVLSSRQQTQLAEDFPFECHVARYVNPWPSRANNVTATVYKTVDNEGQGIGNPIGTQRRPIHLEWGKIGGHFILPSWSDTDPIGAIVGSMGWSSDELQGCVKRNMRPDFIMIDDLDSRDSMAAEHGIIASKIEDCIDKTIAGMAGQSRGLGQFMICTITSDQSAAYKYSDPKTKPTWNGERVQAIKTWPERMDLWETFVRLYQKGSHEGDQFHRIAHQHYLDNLEEMDRGAVVSNPHNYHAAILPDGSQTEVSNLQRCFIAIAKTSREAFDTEYQNDPPKTMQLFTSQVTAYHVSECEGEYTRQSVDPTTAMIVRGIDVRKIELHYTAMSSDDFRRHRLIDYAVESHGTSEVTVEQAEHVILKGLHDLADKWDKERYLDLDGGTHNCDLTLIDKGWMGSWSEDGERKTWSSQPVEMFCMQRRGGLRKWLPAKGAPNYRSPAPSDTCIVGDNWHMNRGEGAERRCTEVIWNANHWHALVEGLFLLPDNDEDRFELFIATDDIWTNHKRFAEHIREGAEDLAASRRTSSRTRKPKYRRDHWWDSAAMMLVAQSIEGWFRENLIKRKRPPGGRAVRSADSQEIGAR